MPWATGSNTHHECFEVRTPPLCKTVADFPLVVHPVRRVELPRIRRWRKALVQTLLQTLDLVLARLEVVSRSETDRVRTRCNAAIEGISGTAGTRTA